MKVICKLKDGTVIEGDRQIERTYLMHIIKINKPSDNSEPEDWTYTVITVDKDNIAMCKVIDLTYDEYVDQLTDIQRALIAELNYVENCDEKNKKEPCECKTCTDPDYQECDSVSGEYNIITSPGDGMYS